MSPKTLLTLSFVLSGVFLVLGIIFTVSLFPSIIDKSLRENLALSDKDSEGFKNFKEPPVDVLIKFYIFHVLNGDSIQNGAKPELEERGPYTYIEAREKVDIERDSKEHLKFGQKRSFKFSKTHSCKGCAEEDTVTVLNAPFMGLVHSTPSFVAGGVNGLITDETHEYYDQLFKDVKVGEFLFTGYKSGAVTAVLESGEELPPQISPENGFAIFNGKDGTADNEYYQVNTGINRPELYSSIEKWGPQMDQLMPDLTDASWWEKDGGWQGSNDCNTLKGTDGQQFHQDVKDDERLWVFSTDLCRSIFIEYKERVDVKGVEALRFEASERSLKTGTKFNLGFCMEQHPKPPKEGTTWDECAKEDPKSEELLNLEDCGLDPMTCPDGMLDVTRCMRESPAILSSPHFLNSPEFLHKEALVGVDAPSESKHATYMDVEPITGAALNVHKRIQINMRLQPQEKWDYLKGVRDVYLPMVWVDEGADIDQENVDKLQKMVFGPITALTVVQWLMVGLGAAGIVLSAGIVFYRRRKNSN